MTTAIIDGDIVAFRSAAAVSNNEDTLMSFDPVRAKEYIDFMMNEWTKRIKPNVILMCFSDSSRKYFRHDIYPEYKGNRDGLERPSALTFCVEYLSEKYKVVRKAGLEADDLLGILGTQPDINNPVVVSIDKDIMTLPCKVFNPDKMRRPIRIHPNVADLAVFKQAITGDSSDNYKGIPGIGIVKADKLLADTPHPALAWDVTRQAFVDAGLTEDYALLMVRLARILRHGDYNDSTGEVRLWTPTKQAQWMTPSTLNTTSSPTASKQKTTSKQSVENSKEMKPSVSPTSLNMSADTDAKTHATASVISEKSNGISKNSSKQSKRKTRKMTAPNLERLSNGKNERVSDGDRDDADSA
jgi:DNA polymerase-1